MWPRRTWGRSTRYIVKRIWRLGGTPHAIALGCAAGVFISFTPFLGFHFIVAALIAWILGGNIIASAFGTFIGNPVTFPFIWISAYQTGNWLLGETKSISKSELENHFSQLSEGLLSNSFEALRIALDTLWPVIKPMLVGGIPIGLAAGAISYHLLRKAIETSQSRLNHRSIEVVKNVTEAERS